MENSIKPGSRPFYDDVNFIAGIERSGFFNIKEAKDLREFGHRLRGLSSGEISPETEDETQFCQHFSHLSESQLYAVRLWQKYLNAIQSTKRKASVFGSKHVNDDSEIEVDASDELADEFDLIDD